MKLVIVESPSKAKTIEKYLGKDYKVRASVGHIRDLPKSNKKAIDIKAGFVPFYEISKGKEKVVRELIDESEKADEVLLATDPDREGEAIAWHIAQACNIKNPKRVAFHEITKEAVLDAVAHPRKIDENLKTAQEARRVLDRLVGYDLSGLIWKKVRYGLSAGRVQSPALRILMEREREIRAFVPEDFWTITAGVKNKPGEKIILTCSKEPRDEKEVDEILKIGKASAWTVTDVKESEVKRSARPPFTTSTLQQVASTRLGFAPSKTMGVAQKLYEAGLITYMRTDSTNLSKQAQEQILKVVEKKFGAKFASENFFKTKSKNAQEAHEAIRPTNASLENAGHTEEQKRLYKLIWQRAVSSQMQSALLLRTKITANVEGNKIPDFAANGSRVLFPGWLEADPAAKGEDVILPEVKASEELNLLSIEKEHKQTQPPSRYTEAGLVKELEKRGIGRPSTYASIIKTIADRWYVEKENKALRPTDTGDVVSTFLENNFANYISDTFTAEMEQKLDDISNGTRDYVKTLKEFYEPFSKEVKAKDKIEKITNLGDADENIKCPKCGGKMIIKLSKTGKFLSCAKFPECVGARTMEGKEMEGPKETGEKCPLCENPLVEREGRFGKFISCSKYPKCKFIKEDEEEKKKKMTGVKCPQCNSGEMMERRGRFGIFYSCSNYPDCKFAIKAKPTGRICDKCGSLMMEGTKTIPERCSNKVCENHNPHKKKK
ncbi:type I DNA topoisomerase [Candidatus Azambacteria bacterium]|nr:type I DNA topoisomerase [Candidatus Azambacteria bacterium]